MDPAWAVLVVVVALGLWGATRGRRGPRRDDEVLGALGFVREGANDLNAMTMQRGGRVLCMRRHAGSEQQRVTVPLVPAPLAYEVLARALGRGEILAALHALAARADDDELAAAIPPGLSAKGLRRHIDRVVALANALEAMPLAEGMARWFVEVAAADRADALQKLVDAFPEAPETLAACRLERDQQRDARAAALARRHLERQPATIAGRAPKGDI